MMIVLTLTLAEGERRKEREEIRESKTLNIAKSIFYSQCSLAAVNVDSNRFLLLYHAFSFYLF